MLHAVKNDQWWSIDGVECDTCVVLPMYSCFVVLIIRECYKIIIWSFAVRVKCVDDSNWYNFYRACSCAYLAHEISYIIGYTSHTHTTQVTHTDRRTDVWLQSTVQEDWITSSDQYTFFMDQVYNNCNCIDVPFLTKFILTSEYI